MHWKTLFAIQRAQARVQSRRGYKGVREHTPKGIEILPLLDA
jgi:hypothetical protein